MIILGEKSDNSNILHIIIGSETFDQFNFSGQSVMDITDYIANMDQSKPCKLIINQCESEEELLNMLSFQESQRKARFVMETIQKNMVEQSSEKKEEKTRKKKDNTVQNHGLKCPLCLKDNGAIIKDGLVYPCLTCQEIQKGLESSEIEKPPTDEDLKNLRNKIEKENPNQKKINDRYKEKDSKIEELKDMNKSDESDKDDENFLKDGEEDDEPNNDI